MELLLTLPPKCAKPLVQATIMPLIRLEDVTRNVQMAPLPILSIEFAWLFVRSTQSTTEILKVGYAKLAALLILSATL